MIILNSSPKIMDKAVRRLYPLVYSGEKLIRSCAIGFFISLGYRQTLLSSLFIYKFLKFLKSSNNSGDLEIKGISRAVTAMILSNTNKHQSNHNFQKK